MDRNAMTVHAVAGVLCASNNFTVSVSALNDGDGGDEDVSVLSPNDAT